jgi:hypothetical protein
VAERDLSFWFLQIPEWVLLTYLFFAQEVGAAFWYGFAFSDFVIYMPLLAAGLIFLVLLVHLKRCNAASRLW